MIEDIRSRINLVHIVEQVLPLKKSGRSFSGLCPFHQEKTPSFTVSEDKQLYHCFGCGAGGTVYNFFMDYYHLSFPEALERASTLAGIDISND
ncbi:MAG: DNA primase, partial [Bdellovibrionales bacterium]|nr:DNA primase [Bdellovibrionales bacterium]